MEGPPSRIERAASRGQLLHYELWRTPGKLGAPIPFNGQASIQGYAARPFPPTQPLDCSRRMAYLRSEEAERSSYDARCEKQRARGRALLGKRAARATLR